MNRLCIAFAYLFIFIFLVVKSFIDLVNNRLDDSLNGFIGSMVFLIASIVLYKIVRQYKGNGKIFKEITTSLSPVDFIGLLWFSFGFLSFVGFCEHRPLFFLLSMFFSVSCIGYLLARRGDDDENKIDFLLAGFFSLASVLMFIYKDFVLEKIISKSSFFVLFYLVALFKCFFYGITFNDVALKNKLINLFYFAALVFFLYYLFLIKISVNFLIYMAATGGAIYFLYIIHLKFCEKCSESNFVLLKKIKRCSKCHAELGPREK